MIRKALSAVLVLLVVVLPVLTAFFIGDLQIPPKAPKGTIIFEIRPGQSVRSIARTLQKERIIRRAWTFLVAYQVFHPGRRLKAGEYEFHLPIKAKDVLHSLVRGSVYLHPLTIPEGLAAREISDLLAEKKFPLEGSFLEAIRDTSPISSWDGQAGDLEGYLYPDTYFVPKNTRARALVETMVGQFKKAFGEEGFARAAELRMPVRRVVILASLIEKETSIPMEKPLVSAVFHNRLRLGMKLDCDPTIIYALKQEDLYQGRLLSKDLKYPSPYNTYLFPDLPPGPICNPGRDSLHAALYPAEEAVFYFVARNDGTHQFSRNYGDHLRAVRKFQLKKK